MRSLRGIILAAAMLTAGFAGSTGCDSVDAAFDCQSVCSRYKTCYDPNFDVDKCRSDCRTASANDPTVREKADSCEACIGPRSCLSATFVCGGDCAVVIAQ